MFKITRHYIGPLAPHSKTKLEFPYEDIHVISMQPSCGCTEPTNDTDHKVLSVIYQAKDIPPHLQLEKKNEYTTNQTIVVKYVDINDTNPGNMAEKTKIITLVFTARIVDNNLKFE